MQYTQWASLVAGVTVLFLIPVTVVGATQGNPVITRELAGNGNAFRSREAAGPPGVFVGNIPQDGAICWTNTDGGSWSVAANWSPNQVPDATNDVFITNSGSYTVVLDMDATVTNLTLGGDGGAQGLAVNGTTLLLNGVGAVGTNGSLNVGGGTVAGGGSIVIDGALNLSGGKLNGVGPITVNGPFAWSGGSISNSAGVTLNGASSLGGAALSFMELDGLLVNAGTLTWSGSDYNLSLGSAGVLSNQVGGTFTIASDVSMWGNVGAIFGNAGLLRKTGDGGTTVLFAALASSGDVQVQTGTLELPRGGWASGTVEVQSNAVLQFGNDYVLASGSSVTGAGTVLESSGMVSMSGSLNLTGTNDLEGGVLAVNAPGSVAVSNLILTSGVLSGNAPVAVNGSFTWSGGIINNTGGVSLNGASSVGGAGSGLMQLDGLLLNAGPLNWSGSGYNLSLGASSTLTNLAAGTITILTDVSMWGDNGATLGNAGLVVKVNPGETDFLHATLVNSGEVQAQSGVLQLTGGGLTSGAFRVASGATLRFNTDYVLAPGSSLTGEGTIEEAAGTVSMSGTMVLSGTNIISGGILEVDAPGSAALSNLNLLRGVLRGSGPVAVNGPFTWIDGIINNIGGVSLNGASVLGSPETGLMKLTGRVMNAGPLMWSGSGYNLTLGSSGLLTNLAGGTITISGDVSMWGDYGSTLGNAGRLSKAGAGGDTTVYATLVNSGEVQVQSGTLELRGGGWASGVFEVPEQAVLQFGNNYALNPGSSVTGEGTVLEASGTLNVSGNLALSCSNVIDGGVLAVSAPGSIVLTNLSLNSGALSGTGPVLVSGAFNWSGGTIDNSAGVTLSGASSIVGSGSNLVQLGGLLINAGTLTWSGGGQSFQFNSGTLTNLAAGTILLAGDLSIENYGSNSLMGNAGILRKVGGASTAAFSAVAIVNTGTVDVQSGILSLGNSYSLGNGTLNFGISDPTHFGQIAFSGMGELAGALSANLNGGYLPSAGDSFAVITYGTRTGAFSSTNLPPGQVWQVDYGVTNLTLQVLNHRLIIAEIPDQVVDELTPWSITNSATEPDMPAQMLTFSLVSGVPGMAVDPSSGVLTWIPQQTNSPSTNTVCVAVTDSGNPPLSATNAFVVIVREVNVPPILPPVPLQTVSARRLLSVTNTAVEANIHSTNWGYGLINAPAGASIDASGVVTWTPSSDQGPNTNTITVVVTNFNVYDQTNPFLASTNEFSVIVCEPSLASPGNYTADAGKTVSFTAFATDNDSGRKLTYGLGASALASAVIDPGNGRFSWRPPVASAGSSNTFQIIVTDDGSPPLSVSQKVCIVVNPLAPVSLKPLSNSAAWFQVQVDGPAGPDYVVLTADSPDAASSNWTILQTSTPDGTPFTVIDTNVSAFATRFYRVRLGP